MLVIFFLKFIKAEVLPLFMSLLHPFEHEHKTIPINYRDFDYSEKFLNELFQLIKLGIINKDWFKVLPKKSKDKIKLDLQLARRNIGRNLSRLIRQKGDYLVSEVTYWHNVANYPTKGFYRLMFANGLSGWNSTLENQFLPEYVQLLQRLLHIRAIIRSVKDVDKRNKEINEVANTRYLKFGYLVMEDIKLHEEIFNMRYN